MPPGSASIEFRPERPFSLSLTDTFTRSTNPATVAPEAGIATGRFTSTSNAITPAANRYQRQDDRAGSQDLQKNIFFLGLTATDQFRLR